MSSKYEEKEKRNSNNEINKKKKHKHKYDNKDEESHLSKGHRHKCKIESSPSKFEKPHKHNKHIDSEEEIKGKHQKSQKSDKLEKRQKTTSISIAKQLPLLSNSEAESDCEDSKFKTKTNSVNNQTSQHQRAKMKQKIYSSSEDEKGGNVDSKSSSSPKKAETTTDNYFDGWTKEEIGQLISRMSVALPKNDTLKYVSRVEKLNWEQVAFGERSPAECKDKWKTIEKKIRGYRILQEMLVDAQNWLEHPWVDFYRGGRKTYRHPDMPKKPLTSYMIFYMKKKEKITKENPGIMLISLSKIIADKFNKLSPKKKAKYNKLANVMKEKYQEDMQKFLHDHPGEGEKIINASKNKKAPILAMPGPAKPVQPLKLFLEDKIKQHKDDENFNQALLIQQCKEKWKSMSSKKKMPWIRWANEAEIKYLEELKSYKAENPRFEMPKFKSVLSKEERKVLQRMEGKPEKPPGSAYGLFSKLMLNDPDLRAKCSTPKERVQEIGKMWKEVPKIEKDGYAEQVKHLIENYKLEYASYLESLPEDKREEELASNKAKRKLKVKIEPSIAPIAPKKLKLDKQEKTLDQEEEEMSIENILAKEPKAPTMSSYELFEEEMKNKGLSSKKIKKSWDDASQAVKQKYELKLEAIRQNYIVEYKHFLTTLKPKELKAYSKEKNKAQQGELESSPADEAESAVEASDGGSSAEESEVEQEEEVKHEVLDKKDQGNSSSSESTSSSSSSASSSSSSSNSSSEEEESDDAF